ncbi:hypothetical protein QBC47DRAFT_389778 [Echria macrotheca]|uniref:Uncharacterized protein n=1 Tax=Echria macrotheca TaxID=438768 RepID=A0AAJ0F8H6_9PEZI|nr:hypothetical protein QBC47DRAFT_389778 [Echria macrotheca]
MVIPQGAKPQNRCFSPAKPVLLHLCLRVRVKVCVGVCVKKAAWAVYFFCRGWRDRKPPHRPTSRCVCGQTKEVAWLPDSPLAYARRETGNRRFFTSCLCYRSSFRPAVDGMHYLIYLNLDHPYPLVVVSVFGILGTEYWVDFSTRRCQYREEGHPTLVVLGAGDTKSSTTYLPIPSGVHQGREVGSYAAAWNTFSALYPCGR